MVKTVAYLGLEARSVEVQCSVAPGLPKFNIVGLADKAVGESKERVRAALSSMGLALPPKLGKKLDPLSTAVKKIEAILYELALHGGKRPLSSAGDDGHEAKRGKPDDDDE